MPRSARVLPTAGSKQLAHFNKDECKYCPSPPAPMPFLWGLRLRVPLPGVQAQLLVPTVLGLSLTIPASLLNEAYAGCPVLSGAPSPLQKEVPFWFRELQPIVKRRDFRWMQGQAWEGMTWIFAKSLLLYRKTQWRDLGSSMQTHCDQELSFLLLWMRSTQPEIRVAAVVMNPRFP